MINGPYYDSPCGCRYDAEDGNLVLSCREHRAQGAGLAEVQTAADFLALLERRADREGAVR